MTRQIKKLISIVLCCSLVLGTNVMASDLNMNADADIYNQQLQETVTIAGEEFMYEYYYDTDNNKCIRVS